MHFSPKRKGLGKSVYLDILGTTSSLPSCGRIKDKGVGVGVRRLRARTTSSGLRGL